MIRQHNRSFVPGERPEFRQGIAVSLENKRARLIQLGEERGDEVVTFRRPAGETHSLFLVRKVETLNSIARRQNGESAA